MDRFWEKVDKGGPDECWEWRGAKRHFGYGMIRVNGRFESAHRVSWMLVSGEMPDLCVLHKCDNPPCVNPQHLFLGTKSDNAQDREDKGRGRDVRGEKHHNSKLTREDVIDIRQRYESEDIIYEDLSKEYGVTKTMIGYIINRKCWRHVP